MQEEDILPRRPSRRPSEPILRDRREEAVADSSSLTRTLAREIVVPLDDLGDDASVNDTDDSSELSLHQLISYLRVSCTEDWQDVLVRARCYPHEIAEVDRRGRTALHAALAKQPPLSVVEVLLEYSTALLDIRDNHARTPLITAMQARAVLPIMRRLIERCPQAALIPDHLGNLPLHLACATYHDGDEAELVGILLRAYPEGVSQEAFNGSTALHAAMEGRAPLSVIQQLVKADPSVVLNDRCGLNPLFVGLRYQADPASIRCLVEACPAVVRSRDRGQGLPFRRALENLAPREVLRILAPDAEIVLDAENAVNKTALHVALECQSAREAAVELMLTLAPSLARQKSRSGETPLDLACRRYLSLQVSSVEMSRPQRQWWRMVELLLRAATGSTSVVHAAAALSSVPCGIQVAALQRYPLEAQTKDAAGCCPLHLVLKAELEGLPRMALASVSVVDQVKESKAMVLLDHYPAAARICDQLGQSPLALAAQASGVSLRVLDRIRRIAPETLKAIDPRLGLYPNQVAALPKKRGRWAGTEEAQRERQSAEDALHLGSIYVLLRQAPDLIQNSRVS